MIETSGHLPECPFGGDTDYSWLDECICDNLRAREARVRASEFPLGVAVGKHDGFLEGYNAALDATRDAIAALLGKTVPPSDGVTEALAAIDGIREATP